MTATRQIWLAALAIVILGSVGCLGCGKKSVVGRTWQGSDSVEPSEGLREGTMVIPGEQLIFRISALGFDAGELAMAAGQPGTVDGRKVIIFRSRSVTTGVVALLKTVVDEVTTKIDLESGATLLHRIDSVEKAKLGSDGTRAVEIDFEPGEFEVRVWENDEKKVETQVLPGDARGYDMTSAMMAMRGWQADEGDTASLFVLRETMFWRTDVEYAGPDSVRTSLGRFSAIRIDGVTRRYERDGTLEEGKDPRYFSMWYSDDPQRLPLLLAAKTDIGDVKMELVQYVGGGREVAAND